MIDPRPEMFPKIRKELRFYKTCSIMTGCMLLILCAEMVMKYIFHLELFALGSGGFLSWALVLDGPNGLESTGNGHNLSLYILIIHGWFYVLYLFGCFRLWSAMRWGGLKLLILASGGVVPLLSFFMEGRIGRQVERYLDEHTAPAQDAELIGAPDPHG